MKIAYFDCFAGASGDMILGGLVDAGLPIERLEAEIAKLHLAHYRLEVEPVRKRGIHGIKVNVSIDQEHHHEHRHLHHIEHIIADSGLDGTVKRDSTRIFRRLAQAEAHVHQCSLEEVHFHEVGAMDAIIDVVGAVSGLHALGVERVFCSPLHVGSGTVECAHGILPVPAPATAELIKGRPVYSTGVRGELLTPTGAAILTTLCGELGPMPAMTIEAIGYGAGTSDPPIPNLLRLTLGESADIPGDFDQDQVAVVEANIDDMNPQIYDHVIERALGMGALDIFLASVHMKKNRTGMLLTIVCTPEKVSRFADFLLKETTTIGLRWRIENRLKAPRSLREISTPFGAIRFKLATMGGETVNVSPEYEDCRKAALDNGVALKTVMEVARAIALDRLGLARGRGE